MSDAPHLSPQYGRGCLIGRLNAFSRRRGSIDLAQVRGAVALATRCGVHGAEITELLGQYGLTLADLTPRENES